MLRLMPNPGNPDAQAGASGRRQRHTRPSRSAGSFFGPWETFKRAKSMTAFQEGPKEDAHREGLLWEFMAAPFGNMVVTCWANADITIS
jgi:hypothetical protein